MVAPDRLARFVLADETLKLDGCREFFLPRFPLRAPRSGEIGAAAGRRSSGIDTGTGKAALSGGYETPEDVPRKYRHAQDANGNSFVERRTTGRGAPMLELRRDRRPGLDRRSARQRLDSAKCRMRPAPRSSRPAPWPSLSGTLRPGPVVLGTRRIDADGRHATRPCRWTCRWLRIRATWSRPAGARNRSIDFFTCPVRAVVTRHRASTRPSRDSVFETDRSTRASLMVMNEISSFNLPEPRCVFHSLPNGSPRPDHSTERSPGRKKCKGIFMD